MKTHVVSLAVFSLIAVGVCLPQLPGFCAVSHMNDIAEIESEGQFEQTAGNNRNAAGFVKYDAPDYCAYDVNGKTVVRGKADDLRFEERFIRRTLSSSCRRRNLSISFDGRQANERVEVLGTIGTMLNGKPINAAIRMIQNEVWEKEKSGTWLMKSLKQKKVWSHYIRSHVQEG